MIPRYSSPKMSAIWSMENRYETWLKIEILACEAMAERGAVPPEALRTIKERASFDVARIEEIEATTKHDVIAFLTNVSERVGDAARYIHLGLTSSDILDTSFSLLLREAADLLLDDLDLLIEAIRKKALEHKRTVMIGRTHGIHAEPITFGLKLAVWYQEMKRNRERLIRAREAIGFGKISGAVGTYSFIDPAVEAYVLEKTGLKGEGASSQIIQRDHHGEFFCVLAIIASSLDKFAQEIRLLQRTEVREAEEYFSSGQKGSSAMPHKRNPVLSENVSGLARLMRSYAQAALENIPLWHERDISHSSVERVIGEDATVLLDFMLRRFTALIEDLVVDTERMEENLSITRGVVFSQFILLKLVERGMSREEAYRLTQKTAQEAWFGKKSFQDLLREDREVTALLGPEEIGRVFDYGNFLTHIDYIFAKVFGERP